MATEKKAKEKEQQESTPQTLKIDCILPGYETCFLEYKAKGWKFKHLRMYEAPLSAQGVIELIVERLVGWRLVESGLTIPFNPYLDNGKVNPELFDNVSPMLMSWITLSFRDAYIRSSTISPS